jgi:predicted NBD/HSP70 family sugar kinase
MSLSQTIIMRMLNAPMSLAEIQELTKASLPTVRRSVGALKESHWIDVVGQAEANGGRPAMLFGVDESHFMVFGLQLQLPGIRLIATDLCGNVLKQSDFFTGEIPAPSQAIRTIVDAIDALQAEFPEREALGLGIASPGFIDAETGDIIAIGRVPAWVNFPICRHLREATGLPLQIANDVDCMAIAEFSRDSKPQQKNLVYIGFCEGIKASLFLQGEMFTGSLGNVGLISSDLLFLPGESQHSDLRRLMTTLGFMKVFQQRVEKLNFEDQEDYQAIFDLEDQDAQFHLILQKSLSDKKICGPLVQDLVKIISVALANIIHLIQPDEIVVGGLLTELPPQVFLELEALTRRLIPPLISHQLIFKQGHFISSNKAALGAIHHFLFNSLEQLIAEN